MCLQLNYGYSSELMNFSGSDKCSQRRINIGAVVLAAGAGSRLGYRPKALIKVRGKTLLKRLVFSLLDAGLNEVIVVTGHYREQVIPSLSGMPVGYVEQPNAQHHQADSLRLGIKGLKNDFDAVMVLPADMPCLTREDLVALIEVFKHADREIEFVGPLVNGQPGNPVIFTSSISNKIIGKQGDFGSGNWRHQSHPWLLNWETNNMNYVSDIDTPEDLADWED